MQSILQVSELNIFQRKLKNAEEAKELYQTFNFAGSVLQPIHTSYGESVACSMVVFFQEFIAINVSVSI